MVKGPRGGNNRSIAVSKHQPSFKHGNHGNLDQCRHDNWRAVFFLDFGKHLLEHDPDAWFRLQASRCILCPVLSFKQHMTGLCRSAAMITGRRRSRPVEAYHEAQEHSNDFRYCLCIGGPTRANKKLPQAVSTQHQPDMQGTQYGTSATMRRNAKPYLKHDPADMRPGLRLLSDPMVPRLIPKS